MTRDGSIGGGQPSRIDVWERNRLTRDGGSKQRVFVSEFVAALASFSDVD